VRICLALVVAMLCAACLGGSAGHRAQTARPSHLGVTAAIPRSWSVAWRPCRYCADPRGVFIATSYRSGAGARSTMCGAVPNHGVAISLDEVLPGPLGDRAPQSSDFPMRPASFRIRTLGRGQVYEGCDVPRARLFRFRDSGRLLYAWVVFGPHPSRSVRGRAEAVLNSLRIAPLP
jgi:hypothetical protein